MTLHSHADSPEISGLLYKKRGGFGKIMPNAWQYRLFVVSKDGVLSYYETEVSDGKDIFDNKERGRIDLKAMRYTVTEEPHEGAPTAYPITICPELEEKWKLCAETRETQQRWLQVLEKFQHINMQRGDVRKSLVYSHHSDDEVDTAAHGRKLSTPVDPIGIKSAPLTPLMRAKADSVSPRAGSVSAAAAGAGSSAGIAMGGAAMSPASTATGAATPSDRLRRSNLARGFTRRKGLKVARGDAPLLPIDWIEFIMVLAISNLCLYGMMKSQTYLESGLYVAIMNIVIAHTLNLRDFRYKNQVKLHQQEMDKREETIAELGAAGRALSRRLSRGEADVAAAESQSAAVLLNKAGNELDEKKNNIGASGKPKAGCTIREVTTEQRLSPDHTWSKADYRLFQVRIGPDYNRFKKKAPTAPALYTPFAADVFCTKLRVDQATERFELPAEYANVNTNHPFVPPIFVIQIQLPSEPPSSLFSTAEDGPGWALMMYYRITEDTLEQLKDFQNASPAVKLFAKWCEKSTEDPQWRARFKVICYGANLAELGLPSAITSYNAKPVLIRRTGSIMRGENYMEMDIHVHKFANLAKQSIHMLSSRCGQMYMQIGFVIEGRDNDELPETLFAAIAANKLQEEQAEFIFED